MSRGGRITNPALHQQPQSRQLHIKTTILVAQKLQISCPYGPSTVPALSLLKYQRDINSGGVIVGADTLPYSLHTFTPAEVFLA
jgi:hypothetical protein